MNVNEFDFELPKESIALRPANPRSSSRMLVLDDAQSIQHARAIDMPAFLKTGDTLVFNDTKVIPARLYGKRGTAKMEITLHKRNTPTEWQAFARPAKKCKAGDILKFGALKATVLAEGEAGERTIKFDVEDHEIFAALECFGKMPLPPYIASQRDTDAADREDYQTTYAAKEGAVAAPTAGLHFDDALKQALNEKGIYSETLTLHVGAGTFLPVKVDDTNDHKMHSEWGEISEDTANRLNERRAAGGRIISVGTTSLRLLESAASEDGIILPFSGDTDIFITPGYKFKAIDGLITNFHLPKSTLFMLVSAFSGLEMMKQVYDTAIEEKYRFYSYGDTSLLFPMKGAKYND